MEQSGLTFEEWKRAAEDVAGGLAGFRTEIGKVESGWECHFVDVAEEADYGRLRLTPADGGITLTFDPPTNEITGFSVYHGSEAIKALRGRRRWLVEMIFRRACELRRYTFGAWRDAMDSVALKFAWAGRTFERFEAGSIVGYRVASGDLPICTLQLTPCGAGAILGTYPPSVKERQNCSWFDAEAEALASRMERSIVHAIYNEVRRLGGERVGGTQSEPLDGEEQEHAKETTGLTEQAEEVRQSQPWDDTALSKLPRLREIRRDAIKRKVKLSFTAACAQVPIDPKTARTHAPELRARWDDKTYDIQAT